MKRGIRGSGAFAVVRTYDPAIEWDALPTPDLNEFLQTRDPALLEGRYIDGERPTVFHCRPLSQSEARDVRGRSDADKYERCFSLCVTRVEALFVDDGSPDGARETWTRPNDGQKARPLSDGVLDRFSFGDVQHVGQVIFAASFSSPDRPLYVPLLDTCRDATTAAELSYRRRRAALMSASENSAASKRAVAAASPAAPSDSSG
jgi:hypothetical protein